MRQEKLEQIKQSIELLKKLTNDDAAIFIINTEGIVEAFYCSEDFPTNFGVGSKIPEGDAVWSVLKNGKSSNNEVPKEVFGTAIEGKLEPIFDEGKVVGVIAYAVSLEKQNLVRKQVDDIKASIEYTNKATENIRVSELIATLSKVNKR